MERRSTPTAISGPRLGAPTWARRLVARAIARDLAAFVVPDARLARAGGLDPEAAGLHPASTPRHASVLLVVSDLPEGLARAAAVAYAQMPRPRAILAAGGGHPPFLPAPDVAVPLDQTALIGGVRRLRRLLAEGAFDSKAAVFDGAAVRLRTEHVCPMHPEIVRDEPGSCPICGMDLVPREAAGITIGHDHAALSTDHAATGAAAGEAAVYACPMHPEITQAEPGRCPLCGMHLTPTRPARGDGAGGETEHEGHDAAGAAGTPTDHGRHRSHPASSAMDHAQHGVAPEAAPNGGEHAGHNAMAMDRGEGFDATTPSGLDPADLPQNHAEMDHAAMANGADHAMTRHAGMDHGGMDHGDHTMGGFMSMVAMTKDLPRSRDGLPMEWVAAPFGPLFPGLPAGLALTLTLDGDTVARAALAPGATRRDLEAARPGPAATFPDRLARLDPLAPIAYRTLAYRALEAASGAAVDATTARGRVGALERERAAGHLGWLAAFGGLLGDRALARRAAGLQLVLVRATGVDEATRIAAEVQRLIQGVERSPLLRRRLAGIGRLGGATEAISGPVARAGGAPVDERAGDAAYREIGFAPVVAEGGDALARLRVRLAEIGQSVDLAIAAGAVAAPAAPPPLDLAGTGEAAIETPRGAAAVRVEVDRGTVTGVWLDDRPRRLAALVPAVAEGAELADALVGVASLDLSPWEIDR